MSESSPELSPFDQEFSDLSDDGFRNNDQQKQSQQTRLSVVPSPAPQAPQAPLKIKLRLNPSTPLVQPDDEKSRKKKHKKKKSHKKHKRSKHQIETEGDDSVDVDDYDHKYHKESEQVNIDDDEEDSNKNDSPQEQPYHAPVGGKRPFAMLQTETIKEEPDASDNGDYYPQTDSKRSRYTEDQKDYYSQDSEEMSQRSSQRNERKPSDAYVTYHPADTSKYNRNSIQQSNESQSQEFSQSFNKAEAKKRGRPLKSKTVVLPPQKVQEQPKKDLKTVCLKLLETLEKRDAYGFFLEPVDTRLITDYLTVIKRPMDFSTMRKNIETGQYRHLDEFRDDFLLIVTNAKTYNAPGTIYWKTADRLQHFGLKSIERAENTVNYELQNIQPEGSEQPAEESGSMTVKHKARKNSWSRKLSTISMNSIKKEPNVKMEEDIDILGLDGTLPLRKASRQGSESLTMREASVDFGSSRAMTPNREPKKKKKKKMNEAGVIYAPDGSLNAVGGVADLNTLLPPERPFADPPQITTVNPQALPSAFYQSRNALDDWSSNKHLVHSAHFCDYGPFTTLGMQTPGAFYTAQDASYIYPLYGDDRGEAYMKSIWDFADGLEIKGRMSQKARYLTRGAWDVARQVLLSDRKGVETEFGYVDVPAIVEAIEEDRDSLSSQSPL
ncbi:hypothetical protein CLU79DRAFT_749291 [Phycomyces nitens]|nr:hypothetical protein CLU79DRAFT_749291 [Phycomyces nitens]